jgi:predicted Fe-Mo cluster-binding NifX family protein
MKVAIPMSKETLTEPIEALLGRAPVFALVDSESGAVQWLPSNQGATAYGAGTRTAQMLASNGAEVVLCRQIGPNALQGLSSAGIRVYLAPPVSAAEAVDFFRRALLTEMRP